METDLLSKLEERLNNLPHDQNQKWGALVDIAADFLDLDERMDWLRRRIAYELAQLA